MIKITVEEIEILVTAKVESLRPQLRKAVQEVKRTVDETKNVTSDMLKKIDMNKLNKEVSEMKKQLKQELNLDVNTDKAVKSTKKATKKVEEQLKGFGIKSAEDLSGLKINGIAYNITGISDKYKKLVRTVQQAKDTINSLQDSEGFFKYNTKGIQSFIDNYKEGDIKKIKIDTDGTEQAKRKLTPLKQYLDKFKKYKINLGNIQIDFTKLILQIEKAKQKVNELKKSLKETSTNKLNNSIQQIKKSITASSSGSKKISSGLSSAKNMASKMGGSLKMGLGQILKIAGALFSLQSIYSTLSNVANTWLSSQNSQAKQLSANIEYMKYALGSTLAPVIEWIVNLIYQAIKGVQSLIYALTGVNIFANASAEAYSNMAKNANSASKATQALAPGDIDEVHNIQEDTGGGSGSGGVTGDIMPNIDLGQVNTKLNDFLKMIKEGKWYEAGEIIGQKINESLNSINWGNIKKKAGDIGKGIAEFINGGIASTDWKLVGKTVAEGINTGVEFAYSFITTFNWKKFGQSIGDTINGFFNNLNWKKIGETLGKGISGSISTIREFIKTVDWSNVAQSIFDFLVSSITNINWGDVVGTIFYLIGLSAGWQLKIYQMVSKWGEELGITVREYFGKKMEEAGGNVALGLWNGITEGLGNIGRWILDNIVNPIIDGFKNGLGIHSPSTVMFEIGEYIIEGLINGILNMISNLGTTISTICGNVKTWFGEKLSKNKFVQNGKNTIEGIKNGIQNNSITSTIKTKCNEVKTWFSNRLQSNKFVSSGKNVINGVKDGIKGNSLSSTIKTKCNDVKTWFTDKLQSSRFVKSGKNVVNGVKSGIKNNSVYSTVTGVCGNVRTWFSNNLASWKFTSIGTNIISGIKTGINNMKYNLKRTVTSIAGKVTGWFKSTLGIHSPSKVMADFVGKFIPLGIAEGIEAQANSVYDSIKDITNNIKLDKEGIVSNMPILSGTYTGLSNANLMNARSVMANEKNESTSTINFESVIKLNGKVIAQQIMPDLNNEAKRLGYKPILQR